MSVYFVLGLLLLWSGQILANSDEVADKYMKIIHKICVEESGVDEELIEMARLGKFRDEPTLRCYMKCTLTRLQIMTGKGEIDVETLISLVPDEYMDVALLVFKGCGTVKGEDDCDTAYLTNLCWYKKAPKNYYLL